MRIIAFIFFIVFGAQLFGQEGERCLNTIQSEEDRMDKSPEYRKRIMEWEKKIAPIVKARRENKNPGCVNGAIIVPVAVHFDSGLVPSAQEACAITIVQDQIDELNLEMLGQDVDASLINNFTSCFGANILGDACIEFCIANQAHPSGFGLVNGDLAVTFGQVSFNVPNGNFTPVNSAWAGYVNIYVDNLGGGLLGVANGIPGNFNGDGVMVDNCVFGTGNLNCNNVQTTGSAGCSNTYDEGETLAHEIGHYFGLRHIWGDNGGCGGNQDFIADTPNMSTNYSGLTNCNDNNCSDLPQTCNSEDMYMNFMSYAGDGCMYMFTSDQSDVMYATAVAEGYTTNSPKCLGSPGPVADFSPFGNLDVCVTDAIQFMDLSSNLPTSWNWTFTVTSGSIVLDITNSVLQNPMVSITSGSSGVISTQLTVSNVLGTDNITKTLNVTVIPGSNTYYADSDSDGYGDPNVTMVACSLPAGFVTDNTDCNDNDSTIFPGAPELCDGQINNCNSNTLPLNEVDNDGDRFVECSIDAGGWDGVRIFGGGDCNDNDININPDAVEICDNIDNDCNMMIDENGTNIYYADIDDDSFGDLNNTIVGCTLPAGYVLDSSDCNDTDSTIYPGAPELCDGQINDCNTSSLPTNEVDNDTDGYVECSIDSGGWDGVVSVVGGNDCNDMQILSYPGNTEVCDNVDNDCNMLVDESGNNTYYADTDGDSYGDNSNTVTGCTLPSGYVLNNTDCDDSNPNINPAATEICDGIDNNCDMMTDENVTTTYYADTDGDTYGDLNNSIEDCSVPAGYVLDSTDCNDTDNTVYPGAPELCDGQINDCNSSNLPSNEVDDDMDGYVECSIDSDGWDGVASVVGGDDCDDMQILSYPGNTEVCDGVDNDCNMMTDENVINTYYADTDGDTFGDPTVTQQACSPPTGFVLNNTDCDDTDITVYPGAPELCSDTVDNNCDGMINEGCGPPPDCDGDYIIINMITNYTYRAEINITSDAIVDENGQSVLFTAGTDIDLVYPFEVVLGTTFEARIEPCTPVPFQNDGPNNQKSLNRKTALNLLFLELSESNKDIKVTITDLNDKIKGNVHSDDSEIILQEVNGLFDTLDQGIYTIIVEGSDIGFNQRILLIK